MASYITLEHLDQTVWSLIQKINTVAEEPHFYASPAAGITSEQIASWNDKPTMTTVRAAITNEINALDISAYLRNYSKPNYSISHHLNWFSDDSSYTGLCYTIQDAGYSHLLNPTTVMRIACDTSTGISADVYIDVIIGDKYPSTTQYTYLYNLPAPEYDHQAANKKYVDDKFAAIPTTQLTQEKIDYLKTIYYFCYVENNILYMPANIEYAFGSSPYTRPVIIYAPNQTLSVPFDVYYIGTSTKYYTFNSMFVNGQSATSIRFEENAIYTFADGDAIARFNNINQYVYEFAQTFLIENTEYNLLSSPIVSATSNKQFLQAMQSELLFSKDTVYSRLTIGTSRRQGQIRLYGNNNSGGYTNLISDVANNQEQIIRLPNASGTVALTSDIPSVPSWALQSTKPTYTASEVGATTSSEVSTMISSAVSGITSFSTEIVSTLPTSGQTGRFYFVPNSSSAEQNIYDEYIYVDNQWEKLGAFNSGTIDLNGYILKSELAEWAKASTKPTYTASEVGALPSNTSYVSSFNGQSGAITYIPPVTSVNGQTGAVTITIPEADDHKWGGITLGNGRIDTTSDIWVPCLSSAVNTTGTAYWACATQEIPSTSENNANLIKIARYKYINVAWYLQSTTPSANDNSTKVATTAYVDSADTALAARVTALENIPWATYYTGSSEPQSTQGNNGDLYFQTGE